MPRPRPAGGVCEVQIVPQPGSVPPYETLVYSGTGRTVEEMERLVNSPRGEQSMRLRFAVEDVVRYVRPKDALSQMAALLNWFTGWWSYLNDPREVELVKDPERLLEERERYGRAVGDCDDAATFLVASLRVIAIPGRFARVGFRGALGDRRFTHVLALAPDQYGRRVILDPVAGRKTTEMLGRVTQAAIR